MFAINKSDKISIFETEFEDLLPSVHHANSKRGWIRFGKTKRVLYLPSTRHLIQLHILNSYIRRFAQDLLETIMEGVVGNAKVNLFPDEGLVDKEGDIVRYYAGLISHETAKDGQVQYPHSIEL